MKMIKILKAATIIISLYLIWRMTRSVEIIAVHDGDTLLVKNFPLFKYQQISWWKNNEENIYEKYKIPSPDEYGQYMVFVLNFGEGYRIDRWVDEDSNLLCFEDMKVAANCIEKEPLLMIDRTYNSKIYYY